MSANSITTETTRDAWLVHDGPGGRVYDLFESKSDALVAHRFHNRPHAPAEIKAIPLRVVIAENEPTPRATIKPAPKGKLTGRWKAYSALIAIAGIAAGTSIVSFIIGNEKLGDFGYSIASAAVVALAFFVMRPPVQYKPLLEAAK